MNDKDVLQTSSMPPQPGKALRSGIRRQPILTESRSMSSNMQSQEPSSKRAALRVLTAILASFGLLASGLTMAQNALSIGTGGTGGVYYPLGGGIAAALSKHIPGMAATAEVRADRWTISSLWVAVSPIWL